MERNLVSIVIPVYNDHRKLRAALRSIFAQTHEKIEVIVVDDGSERPVRIDDSRIKVIHQANAGAPAARNRGMLKASGEYIIFWDADVVGVPTMLEHMVAALEKNQSAAFVYANHYFGKKKMPAKAFSIAALKQQNYIHTTSLIRREKAIVWDMSLKRFQDWDLWLTMAKNGDVGVWIDEYLYTVQSGGTMSTWLPRAAYKAPWKWLPIIAKKVRLYEEGVAIVRKKHGM